jgi:hypothetical protein
VIEGPSVSADAGAMAMSNTGARCAGSDAAEATSRASRRERRTLA